ITARPRIAIGHEARRLLVARGDEADAGLVAERGQHAVELDAGQTEDHADSFAIERLDECLATGHPSHRILLVVILPLGEIMARGPPSAPPPLPRPSRSARATAR